MLDCLLLLFLWPLVGFRQVFASFFQGAECVVVGLQRLPVLADSAFTLAGDIEYLAKLDTTPNFGPSRIAIAIPSRTVGICRGLIIPLIKEHFGDAIMRQRTVFV